MQVGDRLELEITDVAFGGAGVARHAGQVVFVPGTLPGERVVADILGLTTRFARGACRELLVPAPGRVPPRCPHFGLCGGCCYQHADYACQLTLKQKQARDILERLGGLAAPPLAAMMPAPLAWEYRNKLTLHGPGQPGFRRPAGVPPLPVARCALAREPLNRELAAWRDCCLPAGRELVLRCAADGRVLVWQQAARHGAHCRPGPPASRVLIQEHPGGLACLAPAGSFFQVHAGVLDLVLARLAEWFADGDALVDAYCGVGVFALALAGRARRVIGIEADPAAVAAARGNAARLGAGAAVVFRHGTVESRLGPELRECGPGPVSVLLDPPRAGCGAEVIRALAAGRPRRIAYLSCAPPAMARDLRLLAGAGYELRRAAAFDMFPQTAALELLAELVWAGR